MADNYLDYSWNAQPSMGVQLPSQFASLPGWGAQQPSPDGLGVVLSGQDMYKSPYADIFPDSFSGRINAAGAAEPSFFQSMLGTKDAPGWGGLALNAAGGLASTFLGMKQYGLAKKTLAENKRQFQLNYDAQKQTTNARLEGRQAARVSRDPTAYQSVGDYMNKNRIV